MSNVVYNLIIDGIYSFHLLLKYSKLNIKELQAILDTLVRENKIIYVTRYNEYYPLKKAVINIKEAGYGFATVDGEEKDYFIPADFINNAYSGDSVIIYPFEKGAKLYNAKVYKIVERAHNSVVGVLKSRHTKKGIKYYIVSNIKSFPVKVNIREDLLRGAQTGMVVSADIKYEGTAINGQVTEILGYKDDPGIEISQIALEYGFNSSFDDNTLLELENIPNEVLESQKENRADFTNKNIITIDGDDSKDFDDAVYVEKLDNGNYLLEVYIADVSEYVKENSSLDKEALQRGTSVYLADRVIPMLPRKLSNGICSLNEGVERLVLACLMEIDYKGNLVNYEICEGVIKSKHRMTYNNVNKILENDSELCNKYSDIVPMLNLMKELSDIIRNRRYKKGGLEFEIDEYKITLNPDGSPKDIILRERKTAEKLIEDFMLQANETVAYHMNIMNMPCVYRIHEKPDQEKLHNVFKLISSMGIHLKQTQNDIHPKIIQDALEKISYSPYQPILNNMLLRSMMKAKYDSKCLGHYGLSMNYYCHFTSPIRRYPDLMVHRLIKQLLIHPNNLEEQINYYESIIDDISSKNSLSERKAIECERTVDDMLYAWYMQNNIKKKYTGMITSMTSFGMFVTLENGIEGLIPYRDMDGYFIYDDKKMCVFNANRKYTLGDNVGIIVMHSSKETRKIEFMLEEDYEGYFGDINEDYMF